MSQQNQQNPFEAAYGHRGVQGHVYHPSQGHVAPSPAGPVGRTLGTDTSDNVGHMSPEELRLHVLAARERQQQHLEEKTEEWKEKQRQKEWEKLNAERLHREALEREEEAKRREVAAKLAALEEHKRRQAEKDRAAKDRAMQAGREKFLNGLGGNGGS